MMGRGCGSEVRGDWNLLVRNGRLRKNNVTANMKGTSGRLSCPRCPGDAKVMPEVVPEVVPGERCPRTFLV